MNPLPPLNMVWEFSGQAFWSLSLFRHNSPISIAALRSCSLNLNRLLQSCSSFIARLSIYGEGFIWRRRGIGLNPDLLQYTGWVKFWFPVSLSISSMELIIHRVMPAMVRNIPTTASADRCVGKDIKIVKVKKMYLLIRYGHGTKKCHPLSVQLACLSTTSDEQQHIKLCHY